MRGQVSVKHTFCEKNLLVFYLDEVQTILYASDTLYVTENTNHIKFILGFRLFF